MPRTGTNTSRRTKDALEHRVKDDSFNDCLIGELMIIRKKKSYYSSVGTLSGCLVIPVSCLFMATALASPRAEIQYSSYGLPHILAEDFKGAGFGYGYAHTDADICTIADRWVTVSAQRSRYFGPGEYDMYTANNVFNPGQNWTNLESDFFWQSIIDRNIVDNELAMDPPMGPTQEVRDIISGYVAGYNHYLETTGVENIPDERCRGADWVRPITERDVYLRALHWNIFLSSGGLIPDYVKASPPNRTADAELDVQHRSIEVPTEQFEVPQWPASNMIALGSEATDNGRGMLFGNPHWRWHGPERWYETHMRIPGKLDVYGASILGIPITMFGFTGGVAWSHTLATPRRFTVYELEMTGEMSTQYVYDNEVKDLVPQIVKVTVRTENNQLEEREHTFWHSHYGMMVENNMFEWRSDKAFSVRDIAMNFRWLNQTLAMNMSNSVSELEEAGRRFMGIGWLNTIGADSEGNAYYADRTAVPNVPDSKVIECVVSDLGLEILDAMRRHVLDGSRSECEWDIDPRSPISGAFAPDSLPSLYRSDYTTNANDSFWLTNLRSPLVGFPGIIGEENSAQTLRTRRGLQNIEQRLTGEDGYAGNRFSLELLKEITMNNLVESAVLWRDGVVEVCMTLGSGRGLPEACNVLSSWDLTENIDSSGSVLWRRFYQNLSQEARSELYTVEFNEADPSNTPSGLDVRDPRVGQALQTAIADLLDHNVPLDAKVREYQFDERGGERIPIHGGWSNAGQYNFNHSSYLSSEDGWLPGVGWPNMVSGGSYIFWVQYTDEGPVGSSVMTYGQTANPSSPHNSDQTRLFSTKEYKPIRFSQRAIEEDPQFRLLRVCTPLEGNACQEYIQNAN